MSRKIFVGNLNHPRTLKSHLQEKFDSAFMKLDMMECDLAIKTQQKVDLKKCVLYH